jgi:hypothetical protein
MYLKERYEIQLFIPSAVAVDIQPGTWPEIR